MPDKNSTRDYHVSVVIPTLGGASLVKTIERLNSGTLVPSEILICIPEAHAYKVGKIFSENVKIIKTSFDGQVRQRAFGFQVAAGYYVLQLDDDLELHESCLRVLTECIGTQKNVSVSPTLLDNITNEPSSYMSKPDRSSGILYKLLFWVANGKDGYQPGKISKAGVNMAYSPEASEAYEVEWLPGGCALHTKENLVKDNYYPFTGKAFAEDIFHSAILRKKGVRLYHCPKAICSLDNSSSKGNGIFSLAKIFFAFSKIMFRFTSFTGKSHVRLIGFLILHYLLLMAGKIGRK